MPFADLAFARRIEDAWARVSAEAALAHARRLPDLGAAVEEIGGGRAVFFGPGSLISQAQGLGLNKPVQAADFGRLEAFYAARDTPVQIEVCTLADPTLWSLLGERGYRPSEPSHMLVRTLEPSDTWDAPDERLSVEIVGPESAAIFADTVLGAFFEGPGPPPDDMRATVAATADVASAFCWLARVAGVPAGGATSFVIDGLCLFAGDGVLPEFRGRGVHDALLRARLAQAKRLGCALAVTCTQPGSMSQRNAERLGFQVIYARLLFRRE